MRTRAIFKLGEKKCEGKLLRTYDDGTATVKYRDSLYKLGANEYSVIVEPSAKELADLLGIS